MAIKFIPSNKEVIISGEDTFKASILSLLCVTVNKLNRLELQLEKLTDEEVDSDDGDILK